jgi:hypothetical protein
VIDFFLSNIDFIEDQNKQKFLLDQNGQMKKIPYNIP